jgi:DNA-binding response OmpR family regulator
MTGNKGNPIEILLVEDDPAHVRLIQEALKEGRVTNVMSVATDGVEAMAFLRREGKYAEAPRPDLILLDLKLPKKDGREVLVEVKEDKDLTRIPVVILTTSKSEQDIIQSYENHANAYLVKPVGLDQFMAVVRGIEDFWMTLVKLPPE